ncbi:Rab11 family-interacting protein 2 [Channa argus]|uniref:Rab11 family-interacting protein 2 n=1 Tax=Channa argus TaxID=215402 RepID=A0A6G1R0P2_CHAAH|nr:Rab11 family-interacting protein 2 [Channa argus]KAK2922129.1 hypothetical protein Q8A73_001614 [Channa argus]
MSLGEQSQKWFPTHVQATVLKATGLQPKGKNGTNDSYTIIQLGKEKYSTSVAEKTLNPDWAEEASFELPGLLLEGNPEVYELCLTVMHRSLVGMDKFLGQRSINLNQMFDKKERKKTDWYSLESKPGKKKKERGRIQVSIQFMRNNMTASMFDLSMKEKPRSPFSKLKDKMKGRKHDSGFSDASSAILPRSAVCDSEPNRQSFAPEPRRPEPKVKRPLLAGAHKLSAAHSMSDLIGTHFQPKLDSINSIEESGSTGGPHRRSQSEVPSCQDGEAHSDPFTDISDTLPQKYATLPRNRNPFEGEQGQLWDRVERKEKKVSLLERVTGKKEGRKTSNGGRSGSSGDLRSPNPFSGDSKADTNPFSSNYNTSDRKSAGSTDITFGHKRKDIYGKKNFQEPKQVSIAAYSNLSFEEVVQELIKQKEVVKKKDAHIRELEDYIDNLLVRVMEETPSILRTPYEPKKKAGKLSKK